MNDMYIQYNKWTNETRAELCAGAAIRVMNHYSSSQVQNRPPMNALQENWDSRIEHWALVAGSWDQTDYWLLIIIRWFVYPNQSGSRSLAQKCLFAYLWPLSDSSHSPGLITVPFLGTVACLYYASYLPGVPFKSHKSGWKFRFELKAAARILSTWFVHEFLRVMFAQIGLACGRGRVDIV